MSRGDASLPIFNKLRDLDLEAGDFVSIVLDTGSKIEVYIDRVAFLDPDLPLQAGKMGSYALYLYKELAGEEDSHVNVVEQKWSTKTTRHNFANMKSVELLKKAPPYYGFGVALRKYLEAKEPLISIYVKGTGPHNRTLCKGALSDVDFVKEKAYVKSSVYSGTTHTVGFETIDDISGTTFINNMV